MTKKSAAEVNCGISESGTRRVPEWLVGWPKPKVVVEIIRTKT